MIEVAIIGGGIAAAAAALELREKGLSLCVIAPDVPGCSDKIGESLAPSANETLKELGVWESFCNLESRICRTSYSGWGDSQTTGDKAFRHLEGVRWQIDRRRFESFLWKHVPHHRISSIVRQFDHNGEGWQILTKSGDRIEAAFLLDCSGRGSIVGGRYTERRRADSQLAAYSYLTQRDAASAPTPGAMVESRPDGWWYSAPLPDGRMIVCQFFDADLIDGDTLRVEAEWSQAIARAELTSGRIRSTGYAVEGLPVVVDASTTWLESATGDHWAAAGDAAAAFDPLSSNGMSTALWSGRAAALAIDMELSGDRRGLEDYSSQMESGITNFLRERQEIYGLEQRFFEEEYWQRRHSRVLESV